MEGSRRQRCLCATLRRASRLLTRRYEEALAPAGVSPTQFELLQTLRRAGPVDQATLVRLIESDQTTLSRNLKLLLSARMVEAAADSADARRSSYQLTVRGRATLAEAERLWQRVHTATEQLLLKPGETGEPFAALWPHFDRILAAARVPWSA